ncbi:hypothetical protein D3C86_2103700 [compost metagenome]
MPISSSNDKGPMGKPARRAALSISAGLTPLPSIANDSCRYAAITREVKKPRESLTTIGVLRNKRMKSRA